VGGVFLQMLYDRAAWKSWAGRDVAKAANWAPLPKAPRKYEAVPIRSRAEDVLKPGRHLLAVHCKQTTWGQYIDVGLMDLPAEDYRVVGEPDGRRVTW